VQNRKSTKYFETSQKLSVIPLKFHEMSLVLWNLINYCKILQCLVKFCRSPKDLRKILIKWLGKTVKYCLNFVNFHSCTEKWLKFSQLSSLTLTKVYGIPWRFSRSQTFGFNKISSHFCLVYDWNVLLHKNIAVTYFFLQSLSKVLDKKHNKWELGKMMSFSWSHLKTHLHISILKCIITFCSISLLQLIIHFTHSHWFVWGLGMSCNALVPSTLWRAWYRCWWASSILLNSKISTMQKEMSIAPGANVIINILKSWKFNIFSAKFVKSFRQN